MPPLSGYVTTLPTNVILGSCVLYIDGNTPWGVSQGEPTINLPHEYENLDFDGKLGLPIVGLDRRKAGQIPFFEGTFIEMTAARALELEPGGTSAVAASVTTVTPKKYGEFLVAADYKENVRLVFRMAGASAGICLVEFDWGLLLLESIVGASAGNGSYKVRFEARQPANVSDLGTAPYTIKLAADLATVVTPDP
jgi:hypothetical protein